MIRNFFKTALRNLWKNKTTSFINLFGLSIGMAAAVFIFLWVQNELTVDNFHPGVNRLYRITNSIQVNKEESWKWETSPLLMGETALKEIPEVEKTARVIINSWGGPVFNIDHKLFSEKTSAYVDKSWFNMFHYEFVSGNAAAFGQHPFSIILTESKAKKYFGDANPIGQVIRVDTVNCVVQGVVKDNPVNSSFQFDIFMQMGGHLADPGVLKNDNNWNNFGYITFIQLRAAARVGTVEARLNDIMNKNRTNHSATTSLEPLRSMYFESDLQSSSMPHGSKKTTYIFSLLGFLLLITACINYVNLTTAKASGRAREVSVRKVIGARRGQLFFQFIAESLTISLISLLFTILIIKLCLPVFNRITERLFELPLTSIAMWKILLGTLFFATLLNGIYPALMLSSFKPLNVFRGKSLLKLKDTSLRKGLVVFQFGLSMLLIMGTIVIFRQLKFIQTTNPGYKMAQVFSLQVPYKVYAALGDDARQNFFSEMKRQIASQSGIAGVTMGGNEIINVSSSSSGNADWDGRDTTFNPTIAQLSVDEDFQNMFGLQLKSGNWFHPGKEDWHNVILNETAASTFKMHEPIIGQRFTLGGDTGRVIGIVKDFHYKSMHEKIGSMVLSNNQGSDSYFFVKTMPGNISRALGAAGAVWAKFIPGEPFNYSFLDDSFNNLYKSDIRTSQLIFIFSLIAIVISALGLFGLAAYTTEQRAREVGIRKVLGASIQQITRLLSKDFVTLVIIAIGIASPIAWWVMHRWLQDFAYRIDIRAWIFVAAGGLALFIALMSVGIQAIRAAVSNPVKSLRTE